MFGPLDAMRIDSEEGAEKRLPMAMTFAVETTSMALAPKTEILLLWRKFASPVLETVKARPMESFLAQRMEVTFTAQSTGPMAALAWRTQLSTTLFAPPIAKVVPHRMSRQLRQETSGSPRTLPEPKTRQSSMMNRLLNPTLSHRTARVSSLRCTSQSERCALHREAWEKRVSNWSPLSPVSVPMLQRSITVFRVREPSATVERKNR